ncbi:growth-regulating factor 12-like isoform X1 [Wolffia australiana]
MAWECASPSKAARLSGGSEGIVLGPGRGGRSGFTFMQLQELEDQILIFQHLACRVPVPFHLVLPIWKSVAGSSPLLHTLSFPSFMGFSSFDVGAVMDSEPGRCRRTDGKKWRCAKPAVLNQKYCERHMHRGRPRSRKLSENLAGNSSSPAPRTSGVSLPSTLGFSPVSVLSDST